MRNDEEAETSTRGSERRRPTEESCLAEGDGKVTIFMDPELYAMRRAILLLNCKNEGPVYTVVPDWVESESSRVRGLMQVADMHSNQPTRSLKGNLRPTRRFQDRIQMA